MLEKAAYFYLDMELALSILGQVHGAVSAWREVATSSKVGLTTAAIDEFAPAFEHAEMEAAQALVT